MKEYLHESHLQLWHFGYISLLLANQDEVHNDEQINRLQSQTMKLGLKSAFYRRFMTYLRDAFASFWPHPRDGGVFTGEKQPLEILEQCVFVFVHETHYIIPGEN